MAERSASERTEKPTSKRLGKVRGKGQVPQSQELMSFISIVILITVITVLAPEMMQWFTSEIKQGLSCDTTVFANINTFVNFANKKIIALMTILLPIVVALCAGGIIGGVLIGGLNFAPGAISFRFDVLNPAAGFGKLINAKSMVLLLMSILKFSFVSLIVWFYLKDKLGDLTTLRWTWSMGLLSGIAKLILGLVKRICIALMVIAAADVVYQKWKYIEDLKMTKEEIKEEHKQSEGPPESKRRIRKMQFAMALKRVLQDVPKADVVLVNPTHVAVALRYDAKTMEAPVMVAKGADHLAEKIRDIARAYGIPIIRRPELARTIYATIEPGNKIPDILYVAVAEVLALVHRLRNKKMKA